MKKEKVDEIMDTICDDGSLCIIRNALEIFDDSEIQPSSSEQIILKFQRLIPDINALEIKEKEMVANAICRSFGR